MSKKYDVVYTQRYTQNGEEKTKWINCGAVLETAKGFRVKLDAIPVGFDGWFALFEPKEGGKADAPKQPAPAADNFREDKIPF